jgi:hypothetical protein
MRRTLVELRFGVPQARTTHQPRTAWRGRYELKRNGISRKSRIRAEQANSKTTTKAITKGSFEQQKKRLLGFSA